jgi:hypothetical protein
MPVVTRSQKKIVSKNVETKVKTKSNVKEVCLPRWFIKTVSTYLTKITNSDYQDKARLVTEMFYIINQHFEEVFNSFDDDERQSALKKLAETLYMTSESLSISLEVNISNVPMKLRQLALDELKLAKQTLYPYIVNKEEARITEAEARIKRYEAKIKEAEDRIKAEEEVDNDEEKQEGLRRKKLSTMRRTKK